jgi:gliding motility-associated-like protein
VVTDGDVVYAEVVNTGTFCSSNGVAVIPVSVDPRPEVDISSFDNSIICVDTDPSTPVEGGDYDVLVIDTQLEGQGLYFEWTYNGSVVAGEDGPTLEVGGGAQNPLQAGEYTVQAFDTATMGGNGNNCGSNVDTIDILESNPPEFTVTPTSVGFAGEHSLVVTGVTGSGDYEFSVDNGPWTELPSTGELSFGGLSAGGHIVYGRDRDGCGVTASDEVSFIDFPPFFTPNGDGYNDTWNITGLGTELNRGAQVFIFDRYGKLLKQLSPSATGWDGTYNGNPLPSGDYWFSVEYLDPAVNNGGTTPQGPVKKTFKNHFTLKR